MSVIIDGSAGITTNAGGSVNPSTNVEGINYSCRAWVNFNGTGTVAIRASGNVTSITDRGVGLYTITFTTALSDANYCGVASTTIGGATNVNRTAAVGPIDTVSAYCNTWADTTGAAADVEVICAAIFR